MKKSVKDSIITTIATLIVLALIALAYFGITAILKAFETPPPSLNINTKNVEKYVFVDNIKTPNGLLSAHVYDTKEEIDEISKILDNAKLYEKLSYGYMKSSHYIDYEKYMYIIYDDGTQVMYSFYGQGSTIIKDLKGKYGKVLYGGETLSSYVKNHRNGYYVDENLNYVEDYKDFSPEVIFGPNYDSPWLGQ